MKQLRIILRISIFLGIGVCLGVIFGCKSFYQETGISITAGDVSAPVEVSDASDILTVRALFSMSGMRFWSSRGYSVYFDYNHIYTNSYLFGMVETKGRQGGTAVVVATNDFSTAAGVIKGASK